LLISNWLLETKLKLYNPVVPVIPQVILNLFSQVGALLYVSRFLTEEFNNSTSRVRLPLLKCWLTTPEDLAHHRKCSQHIC